MKWIGNLTALAILFGTLTRAEESAIRGEQNNRQLDVDEDGRINLERVLSEPHRIVGGNAVRRDDKKWDFIVSLQKKSNNPRGFKHFCGGSLISERFVLTAGHCVKYSPPDRIVIGRKSLWTDKGGEIRKVVSFTKHKWYYGVSNDIAILELDRDVTSVTPVVLNKEFNSRLEQVGTNLMVAGWGYMKEYTSVVDDLREVMVPVVSKKVCSASYSGIRDANICAGYQEGKKDSCGGDSGGPLIYYNPTTKKVEQVGIVSWGMGCARAKYYGVYTRISHFIDFIKDTVRTKGRGRYSLRDAGPTTPEPTPKPTTPKPTSQPTTKEFGFCSRQSLGRCRRTSRCFVNHSGKNRKVKAYPRNACLPKSYLAFTDAPTASPTMPPTPPTPAPTFSPKKTELIEKEVDYCAKQTKRNCKRRRLPRSYKKGRIRRCYSKDDQCLSMFCNEKNNRVGKNNYLHPACTGESQ